MLNSPIRCYLPLLLAVCFCGCHRDEIVTYTAQRDQPLTDANVETAEPDADPVPTRMLAAMLPHDDVTWFFKLTGDPDELAGLHEQFGLFVASTKFQNEAPDWDIPDTWREQKGRPMRFTTFLVGDTGLDVSISVLSTQENENDFLLLNANRWRGQLTLDDLSMEDFLAKKVPDGEGEIVELKTQSGPAILLDIVGAAAPQGGGPPFAGMANHPPIDNAPPQQAGPAPGGPSFKVPENWTSGEYNGMRFAAFEVGRGADKAVITITSFGGTLLANFNRWRDQVGLAAWSAADFDANIETLTAGDLEMRYAKLLGEETSILGAILEHGGRTWFVKMSGPTELVKAEIPHFEAFASSIRFE